MLLALIILGSSTAFNAIGSITIAGLFTTYVIAIMMLVRKRLRKDNIRFGPWSLGKAGIWINIYAITYLIVAMIFTFFPPELPVTPKNMNYSSLVFGAAILFGLVFYAVRGRKVYHGPVIDDDVPLDIVMEEIKT